MRDYYCSNKFKFLKIDLERAITYNCHAAQPHNINLDWLRQNPGQLFNSPISVNERSMMLRNERNSSCEQNCWPAEDKGQISVRMLEDGVTRTHHKIYSFPEILDITLDTDCNLKCVYCCKEYSSAWRQELEKFGSYNLIGADDIQNRYSLNQKDRVIQLFGQRQKQDTAGFKTICSEIEMMVPKLKAVIITGGEPFLSSQLITILNLVKSVPKIKLFTSLGVKNSRVKKLLDQISIYSNLFLAISAESQGTAYNFLRYGNSYEDFERNLQDVIQSKIKFQFHSSVTNLGLESFFDFYQNFLSYNIDTDFVYTPNFLAVNVLDLETKKRIEEKCLARSFPIFQKIQQSISATPSEDQRHNLKVFLNELLMRRKIDLNFISKDLLNWLE